MTDKIFRHFIFHLVLKSIFKRIFDNGDDMWMLGRVCTISTPGIEKT